MNKLRLVLNAFKGNFDGLDIDYSKITSGRENLVEILSVDKYPVYGVNLLPGHMDTQYVTQDLLSSYQRNLLDSHCIPARTCYSKDLFRLALTCKTLDCIEGELGVSSKLVELMVKLLKENTLEHPLPKGLSYSSGDVIPGTHFARKLIEELESRFDYTLQPGELMALINGDFIHKSRAIHILEDIEVVATHFTSNTFLLHYLSGKEAIVESRFKNRSKLGSSFTQRINQALNTKISYKRIQKPVSIRASGDLLALIGEQIERYVNILNDSLQSSSGNPIYKNPLDFPVSQASFLNFQLAEASLGLNHSFPILMRSVSGRVNYLLSGQVNGIALNGASSTNPIQLIQHPKAITAKFEQLRGMINTNITQSLGQTSYGVEDLWTNGLNILDQLEKILTTCKEILELESFVLLTLIHQNNHNLIKGENHTDTEIFLKEDSNDYNLLNTLSLCNKLGFSPPSMPWNI